MPAPETAAPTECNLAQVNVMHTVAPIHSDAMQRFRDLLFPLAELAERSTGFVWRLPIHDAIAAGVQYLGDEQAIMMISVWRSGEDLWNYVYASRHLDAMRQRRDWTVRLPYATFALWWCDPDHQPSPAEGSSRLGLLRQLGPTPEAFNFRQMFPCPAGPNRETGWIRTA